MAATLFDIAAERLEASTDLDRLAVRGTLRLALKKAGLEPQNLNLGQLHAVLEKLMPRELEARGVANPAAICSAVMNDVMSAARTADLELSTSPDEIFKRLGGS